jgi:hypothetical protein
LFLSPQSGFKGTGNTFNEKSTFHRAFLAGDGSPDLPKAGEPFL